MRFQGGLKLQLAGCEMGESECTEISAALASLSPSGEDSADDGTRTRLFWKAPLFPLMINDPSLKNSPRRVLDRIKKKLRKKTRFRRQ